MDCNPDDEFSEFFYEQITGAVEEVAVNASGEGDTKSSRRLPEQWSRVISLDADDLNNVKSFPIATDLLMADGLYLAS